MRRPIRDSMLVLVVVDLNTGSAELVSSATVSADGFHPSDRGYELIAERFLAAMRRAGMRVQAERRRDARARSPMPR